MDDRDCGVATLRFLHEQQCNRFSDNHASSKNDHMRAGDLNVAFDEQSLNAEWRARNKSCRVAHRELCHVHWMKTIDVLRGIERTNNCRFVDMFWRRRLNEDAVNRRIAI